jgi:predicted transcriptional regulator
VFISVTLKLPAKLKVRVARAAKQKGQSMQRWMFEAIEHEVERRERFLAYVKQAQHQDLNLGPSEEIDARNRVRFWLEKLSSGKRVVRMTPRRAR